MQSSEPAGHFAVAFGGQYCWFFDVVRVRVRISMLMLRLMLLLLVSPALCRRRFGIIGLMWFVFVVRPIYTLVKRKHERELTIGFVCIVVVVFSVMAVLLFC
jgi:hypothetical protein